MLSLLRGHTRQTGGVTEEHCILCTVRDSPAFILSPLEGWNTLHLGSGSTGLTPSSLNCAFDISHVGISPFKLLIYIQYVLL